MSGWPPDQWFAGCTQIGNSGVYIALGDTPAETIIWHLCGDRWEGACITNHTIVTREPLTITASLACRNCAWHGWITEGNWIPA